MKTKETFRSVCTSLLALSISSIVQVSASGATITGDTNDLEIHDNGSSVWVGQADMRVGGASSSYDGVAVFLFELPTLGAGESVQSASLSFELLQISNSFTFDADLYGLPYRTTASVNAGSDYYDGAYAGDGGATALQEDIMTDSMSLGVITTDSSGSVALVDYLNAQYNAGAVGGDFVAIRISPDTTDAANYRYYVVGSANHGTAKPVLTVEVGQGGDTTPPSVPTGLVASNITDVSVDLDWNASIDDVGVAGYNIYTNSANPASLTIASATVTGLSPSTSYDFTVSAYDAASNESLPSSSINVTTNSSGVLISEDFTSSVANFTEISGGDWNLSGGRYVLSNPASSGTTGVLGNISVHNMSISGDFTLSTVLNITGTGSAWNDAAVVFGFQDSSNYYYMSLNESNDDNTKGLLKIVDGTPSQLADISISVASDTDYPIVIQRSGSSIVASVNSSQVASASDSTFTSGKVGVGSYNDGASFDDFTVSYGGGDTEAPSTPAGLSSSNITTTSVDLDWSVSTDNVGVTGYKVYIDGVNPVTVAGTGTTISGLSEYTSYTFTVSAMDATGNESSQSSGVSVTTTDGTAPSTPAGLSAGGVTATSVDLSWNASTDNVGVTGYKVYTDGGNPVTVTGTSTTISGLSENTSYTFTVSAIDAAGNESSQSAGENVTTATAPDITPPSVPTGLVVVTVTTTSVDLSWNASTDNVAVTGYKVYTDGSTPIMVTGTGTTISGLSANMGYDFTVSAIDAVGNESSQSSAVSATTDSGSTTTTVIYGDVNDNQAQSNGSTIWVGQQELRVGGASAGVDGSAVYLFALPSLGTGESVVSASLTFELLDIVNSFGFNADLYGLSYRTTASVTGADWWQGDFGTDSNATGLQDNVMTPSSIEGSITTDATGSLNLLNYINAQYTAGAVAGDFVVLRLNADTADAANYYYYKVASANNSSAKPYLTLEIGSGSDTTAPSAPTGLSSSNITTHSVDLSWSASNDNVGVTGYKVYTDGSSPVTVTGTSASISGLSENTSYTFAVSAIDAAGNESNQSSGLNVTTTSGASAPSAFTAGQWSLADNPSVGGDQLTLNIQALPANGGSSITNLEYRYDSGSGYGAAQSLSGTGTGTQSITVTSETEADVQIRAVNANGSAPWSDVKTATPTTTSAGTVTASMNGISFTITNALDWGTDATGRVWATIPSSGSQITAVSGATGMMLNPQRTSSSAPSQGYRSDMANYGASLNELGNLPIGVVPGDIVLAAYDGGLSVTRDGSFAAQATVHFISAPVSSTQVLPQTIGHSGRTTPDTVLNIDIDAWYSARPVRSASAAGASFPAFADLYAAVNTFSPTITQIYNANGTPGYEGFSVKGLGAGPTSTNDNYGRSIASVEGICLLALVSDVYTEAEVKQLALASIMQGIELGAPVVESGTGQGPDGGHYQFGQAWYMFAMDMTGQASKIDTMMDNGGGGNWYQAFEWTPARLADLQPHTSSTKPGISRIRTLPTQPGGNVLRIPVEGTGSNGDDNESLIAVGQTFTDGTTTVTAAVETTFPNTPSAGTTIDISLTGANPWSGGAQIWGTMPSGWGDEGDFDWVIRGPDATRWSRYWPAANILYRPNQRWGGNVFALHLMGLFDAQSHRAVIGYTARVFEANNPTATNDYPASSGGITIGGTIYNPAPDFWSNYWTGDVENVPQRNTPSGITPTQDITLNKAVAPGTTSPGNLQNGIVIGLVPGDSVRSVELHGTGTNGTTPQVRIRRKSDSSTVQDWTTVTNLSWNSTSWSGTVTLPKGDEWWDTDVRYLEDTSDSLGYQTTNTTQWAVGYKIMVIGQSQLWRWIGHTWDADPTPFSTGMDGIVSFFDYGASGALSVYGNGVAGGDGVAMTANIIGDGDPTPIMFFSEWVSGTGVDQFLDDNDSSRSWNDLQARVDAYGSDFTATVSLYGSDSVQMNNHYPKPPYTYDREVHACVDWTTGDVQYSTSNGIVEHYFNDVCQSGAVHTFACIPRYAVNGTDSTANEILIADLNARGLPYGCPTGDMTMEDEGSGPGNQHSEEQGPGSRAMGKSMGLAVRRGMGMSAPANPYFAGTGTRSSDGTYIEIDLVLPNGGGLYSRAPNALSSFSVSENSGSSYSGAGFTASISGTKVRITRDSGTWASAASLRVRKVGNLNNHDGTIPTDEAIVNGELYETVGGVYTDGIPVHGVMSGGDWTFPYYSEINSISQQ